MASPKRTKESLPRPVPTETPETAETKDEWDGIASEITGPTDAQLTQVAELAQQWVLLSKKLERMTAKLKEVQEEFRKLDMETLPQAMLDTGMKSIALVDGTSVQVIDKVAASISKKNQAEAFEWLRENGHGPLIKVPEPKESVHPQTLLAFVNEQLRNGIPLPECFTIFEYATCKVVTPE